MRYPRELQLNLEALLKMAVLLGFAWLFHTVVESGNAQFYVHPRIVPYMRFGTLVFVVIAFFAAGELFKPARRKVRLGRYLLFILPLLLAFALPPRTPDTSSMSLSNGGFSSITGDISAGDEYEEEGPMEGEGEFVQGVVAGQEGEIDGSSTGEPEGGELSQEDIRMESQSFIPWIEALYENPEKHAGRKVEVTGFVFKDRSFRQNEFVPARLTMACCAADMQPIGLLCRYPDAAKLKKDAWVKVTGTVRAVRANDQLIPVIEASVVEPAQKPENEFVFPD